MKKLWLWLLLGLLLRLVLIPISLHPDFRAVNLAAYFVAQQGEFLTFYDHISKLGRADPLVNLYGDNLFIYPPLAYLSHAVFNKLFYWAYPQSAFWILINDIGQLRQTTGFTMLMYWLKLPYLLADIAILYLLLHYRLSTNSQRLALLWWFNPVVLYTSYLVGQFDIFVAFFILLAYVATLARPWLAPIALGIGAAFKPFPLFLLPLLPGPKIKNLLLGLGVYGLTIVPYLRSPAFKQYALLASQSDKMFFARIPISGSQYLPIFLMGLILIYWWNHFHPKQLPAWAWISAPLLLFYSVTHFHPQWFIWIMPILVLAVASSARLVFPYVALLLCYFTIVLFFEPSLNFGLFGINFSLANYVNAFYSSDQLVSLIRGIFLATSAYLIIHPGYEKK